MMRFRFRAEPAVNPSDRRLELVAKIQTAT